MSRFFETLREGRRYGYPVCCRLRFALVEALDLDRLQARERGVRFDGDFEFFVPCGVFHQKALSKAWADRILAAVPEWPPPELEDDDEEW